MMHVRSVFLLWTGTSVTNDYLGRFDHPRPAVSVICVVQGLVGQSSFVLDTYDGAEYAATVLLVLDLFDYCIF
jgi:hypothetical protein